MHSIAVVPSEKKVSIIDQAAPPIAGDLIEKLVLRNLLLGQQSGIGNVIQLA